VFSSHFGTVRGVAGCARNLFALIERFRAKWIPVRIAIKLCADCVDLSAVENASKQESRASVLIQSEAITL
jgi:hypothetical protein